MRRKGRAWPPAPAPCCCLLLLSHQLLWDAGLWTLGGGLISLPIQQVVSGVCGMQTTTPNPFLYFFPKARPLSVWRCVGKGQEASRGGSVSGLWAGSARLPPLPPWALGTIPPPRDTQFVVPACPHPSPALSLTPSRS